VTEANVPEIRVACGLNLISAWKANYVDSAQPQSQSLLNIYQSRLSGKSSAGNNIL